MRKLGNLQHAIPSARRGGLGALLTVFAVVGGGYLLWLQLKGLDLAYTRSLLQQTTLWQWALAGLATLGSFLALGRYDALWHKVLETGIDRRRASLTGMSAIAIGQTIGMASITSALIRWRCIPELGPVRIAGLTAAVSTSFMLGWAALALWAGWFLAEPVLDGHLSAFIATAAILVLPFAWVWARKRWSISVSDLLRLMVWIALDIAFASMALWAMIPLGTEIGWLHLFAAYTLALGAGLIGNSPGGLGPFELVLLTALASLETEAAVSAVLGYRVVYFLVPFVFAVLYTAKAVSRRQATFVSGPADWGLARQSGLLQGKDGIWMHTLKPIPGLSIALGDPVPQRRDGSGRLAMPRRVRTVYKSSPRLAASARNQGWHSHLIAREAIVDLTKWTLDGPKRKRLRQALRRADRSGVVIEQAIGPLPLVTMKKIARQWARSNGGELGGSMGRYSNDYVAHQKVFLIFHRSVLRGFVTCHAGARDWSLDLMRHDGALPDGAMQSAVCAAIEAASAAGATQFSLGAVPATDGVLARWSAKKSGLCLFKSLFDPSWHPRYLISRSRADQLVSAIALYFLVQRPLTRGIQRIMWNAHDRLAEIELAAFSNSRDTRTSSCDEDAVCPANPTP